MKSGKMKFAGSSRVSWTTRRIDSVDLKRRGRCVGKGICKGFYRYGYAEKSQFLMKLPAKPVAVGL